MLITRNDIQRIGDEETLLCFLEERLNLPIPVEATLAQIALPLPLPFLGLDEFIAEQIIDCQDFRGLPKEGLGDRRPFLIRFRSEQDYSEILREVAGGLHQKNTNPAGLFFICADECFQPFAFAYFNDSESGNWDAAVLNILAWTQNNTHIHTSSEHGFPVGFFANESLEDFDDELNIFGEEIVPATSDGKGDSPANKRIGEEFASGSVFTDTDDASETFVDEFSEILDNKPLRHIFEPTLAETLLAKLQNIGTPLERHKDITIYIGLDTTHKDAFVIDEYTRESLIAKDPDSAKLIESFPKSDRTHRKWRWELSNIIYIKSSNNKRWPWSGKNEWEAERIFKEIYPAISEHMNNYKDILTMSAKPSAYYWEIPPRNMLQKLEYPKIIYPATGRFMHAAYDPSHRFLLSSSFFIPTTDRSLLAILNSKLFSWYAHKKYRPSNPQIKRLYFTKKNMVNAPIAKRTEEQKEELSDLVQRILDAPNSTYVPNLEEEINMLVYKLYELTTAEIDLIEKGNNQ